jgi:hypothetical protein
MNIKPKAVMMATGAGVVFQGAIVVVNIAASLMVNPAMMGGGSNDGVVALIGVMSVVLCLCALILDGGVGALYAFMHSREAALTVGDAAIGGGVSGLVTRIVTSLCAMCVNLAIIPLTAAQVGNVTGDPSMGALTGMFGMMGGVVGGIIGVCIGAIVGIILGAIGGAIAGAVLRGQSAAV